MASKISKAEERDLLARTVLCLLMAAENGIDVRGELGHTGWYLTYATGRDWPVMAQKLVTFVTDKLAAQAADIKAPAG